MSDKCDVCGAHIEFSDDWTEEQAVDEYKKKFGAHSVEDAAEVCEPCWNKYVGRRDETLNHYNSFHNPNFRTATCFDVKCPWYGLTP